MIDRVVVRLQRALSPDTQHWTIFVEFLVHKLTDEAGIAPVFMPLQSLQIHAHIVTNLITFHQFCPFIDNGGLQPTGGAAHAVPQEVCYVKVAKLAECLAIKAHRIAAHSDIQGCCCKNGAICARLAFAAAASVADRHELDRADGQKYSV